MQQGQELLVVEGTALQALVIMEETPQVTVPNMLEVLDTVMEAMELTKVEMVAPAAVAEATTVEAVALLVALVLDLLVLGALVILVVQAYRMVSQLQVVDQLLLQTAL